MLFLVIYIIVSCLFYKTHYTKQSPHACAALSCIFQSFTLAPFYLDIYIILVILKSGLLYICHGQLHIYSFPLICVKYSDIDHLNPFSPELSDVGLNNAPHVGNHFYHCKRKNLILPKEAYSAARDSMFTKHSVYK